MGEAAARGGHNAYLYEGGTFLETQERAELGVELGQYLQRISATGIEDIIGGNRQLHALIAWLIESGSGAETRDSQKAAHVRLMLAGIIGPLLETHETGRLEEWLGRSELDEVVNARERFLIAIDVYGLGELPDPWDTALRDLTALGNPDENRTPGL